MRVIIHVGMHKTGSSSIQNYFAQHAGDGIKYASWRGPNHSGLFALLFQELEEAKTYHGFNVRGQDFLDRLGELQSLWRKRLDADLAEAKASGKDFILSAEDISAPPFEKATIAMRDLFEQWTDEIVVIGYVRPPLSYARSAFQQRLKGGAVDRLKIFGLWPAYRKRFEKLDTTFGRGRVHLKKFDPDALFGGNVVTDFGHQIGVDVDVSKAERANATLSLEATALLFLQRLHGDGYVGGFPGAPAANDRFIAALGRIGSRQLGFSDALWGPVLRHNDEDMKWMEARLGTDLADKPDARYTAIDSEDDLIAIALENYPALEKVLIDSIKASDLPAQEKTARALDSLRRHCY